MFEIEIVKKEETIIQVEKFDSMEEAVAYLYGKAVAGSLFQVHKINIYFLESKR